MDPQNAVFGLIDRSWLEAIQATSAVVSLAVWLFGGALVFFAWRGKRITGLQLGPFHIRMKEDAVQAAADAVRAHHGATSSSFDLPKIRATIESAFDPQTAHNLLGKTVLWVDDRPNNNKSAVRALRKVQLEIDQVRSTSAALDELKTRKVDLIISDMARGPHLRAGFTLLDEVRKANITAPYIIFSSLETAAFRHDAEKRGAILATNDALELISTVIDVLGRNESAQQ